MVLRNYSYLWASVSKWDNYRHPLTVMSGFLPLFQGPGNHCHVGLFMPNQWEGFDCSWALGDCRFVGRGLNQTAEQPATGSSRFTLQEKFSITAKYTKLNFIPTVDKCSKTFLWVLTLNQSWHKFWSGAAHARFIMITAADLPLEILSNFSNNRSSISDRGRQKAGFSFLAGDWQFWLTLYLSS